MHPVARALKTLALLALLALPAAAQLANMDQSCTVRQSKQTSGSGSTIPYASNVVSGNLLAFSYHTRANVTTPTITDTLGSTWTLRTTQGTTNTWVYTWTATAAGSGADTVTITKSGGSIERFGILELGNCPEVIDATTTANVTVSSGNITLPNITTTAYRDFILWVVFSNTSGSRTDQSAYNYTWDIVSQYNATDAFTYLTDYSGEPGAFTGPTIGAAGSASVGVIAIKMASALTVSTPKLPDAVSGTAYSFQLHAKGGAGTNVWTKTAGSLPCGLSLSSSGVISGTPTCSNANTITFQVTDSAAAMATKNLTINVGTSFNTIAQRQSRGGSLVYSSNVLSGSVLVVSIGSTTAFGTSEFTAEQLTDTLGTVYSLIPGSCYSEKGSIIYGCLYWGVSPGAGANTVSLPFGISSSSSMLFEFTNVQTVFDLGLIAKLTSNAGGATITSGAITIPASSMLWGYTWPGSSGAALTAGAGFASGLAYSAGGNGGQFTSLQEYEVGAAAGSSTATWGVTSNASNIWSTILLSFRPTVSGTAPIGGGYRKKGPF